MVILIEMIVGEEVDLYSVLGINGFERVFIVMQMCNFLILRVKLKLDEMLVEVVVDMVVEVIIILDKVYVILELRLWVLKEIMMYVVGWGMVMKIVVVGLVYLKIGFRLYVMEVYVVLIKDDMLLGLNFMVIYGVVLDLKSYIFSVGGE